MSPIKIDPEKPSAPPPPPTWSIGSFGNASIDHWDASFLAASKAVHEKKGVLVDPRVLKAMMQIESGGDGNYPAGKCRTSDAYDSVPACGPMQIKRQYHQARCPECDFKTVPGQIELAAHILADTMRNFGLDEYDAIKKAYFPGPDGSTTQSDYIARVKMLVMTMAHGTTHAPPPPVAPAPKPVDLITAIVGGENYTDAYGFKAPTDLGYYGYFVGHGGNSNQHTGIDVTGPIGEALYSPISGTVVCAGTGIGAGAHGSSCAAFAYDPRAFGGPAAGNGPGRFEILADDGKRSLILGHVLRSLAAVGSKVKPGQHVADLGGMNGAHVHVEARIWEGGNYTIVDPRQAFGKVPFVPSLEKVPYNFDMEKEPVPNLFTVRALKKLSIYQRADPKAVILDTIEEGDIFQAVAMVPGNDGKPWFLGVLNGRVPTDGTELVES